MKVLMGRDVIESLPSGEGIVRYMQTCDAELVMHAKGKPSEKEHAVYGEWRVIDKMGE